MTVRSRSDEPESAVATVDDGTISDVVAAEREWRDRLAKARADAEAAIQAAQGDAARALATVEAELGALVAAHRATLAAAADAEIRRITEAALARSAALAAVPDETLDRVATDVARTAPWIRAFTGESS